MRRVGRGLLRAVAIVLVLAAAGPVSSALAEPPHVTIRVPTLTPVTPTIEGEAGTAAEGDESVSVTVTREGGGEGASGSASVNLNREWEFSPGHLADGTYRVQASQRNETTGEEGFAEAHFTIESTPPKVTINPVPTVTKAGPLTLTGAAGNEPGDEQAVAVTISGPVGSSGPASVSPGSWSYVVSHLTNGTYTAEAKQQDKAGNVGHASTSFKVEVEPPKVTITSVPSPTIEARPTLKGTAGVEEGAIRTVSLTLKAVALKGEKCVFKEAPVAVPVGAGGEWEYHAGPLCDGTYSATATQKNEAGSEGKTVSPVTFEVTTPPPAVTLSTSTFVTRSGVGLVTNATPSFTGTAASGAEDAKSVTINIYKGETATGTPVTLTGALVGTTWTAGPLPAPGLTTEGKYTAQVTQSDEAENVGKSVPGVTFTVDNTKPPVTLTEPTSNREIHVSRPTFSGAAGVASGDLPAVTLDIYEGSSVSGKLAETVALTASGASWTTGVTGPRLPNGTYTARAEQRDDVGNIGKSAAVTFKIETTCPLVTINTAGLVQRGVTLVSGPNPSFDGIAGTAHEDSSIVVVKLYSGISVIGSSPVQSVDGSRSGSSWAAGPAAALGDGVYTAQAEQEDTSSPGSCVSSPSRFTVDATPPQLTLTSPANGSSTTSGSQLVTGSAGTAEGDLPGVTVQLFSGAGTGGSLVQSVNVPAAGAAWSATVAGLSPGTYTVRAEQSDDVGNVGFSPTATFAVTAPLQSVVHPITASFSWVPSVPHTGEPISLLSSSTDGVSPITAFAWDLAGSGAFTTGASVMTTSFSTPGKHLVQLRVTDASGATSLAAQTIPVTTPSFPLMRPFPIVRIVASYSASSVRLKLLSVQASGGARISVSCKGRGCPVKSQTRVAATGKVGKAPVVFRRFERTLKAGVILEVRVSKPGQIGKYTRFTIRHGRLPVRTDSCLGPAGSKPIACPSS